MSTGHKAYKTQSVQTASREKILLLLYEAAIKFTKKSIRAIESNDIAQRGYCIGRVYDIVMELNNTLNHEVGGEISSNLEQLYGFLCDQLTQANVSGDKAHLETVLGILEKLYSGWKEAIGKMKAADATGA